MAYDNVEHLVEALKVRKDGTPLDNDECLGPFLKFCRNSVKHERRLKKDYARYKSTSKKVNLDVMLLDNYVLYIYFKALNLSHHE